MRETERVSHDLCGVITSDKESLQILTKYKTACTGTEAHFLTFKTELRGPSIMMKFDGEFCAETQPSGTEVCYLLTSSASYFCGVIDP